MLTWLKLYRAGKQFFWLVLWASGGIFLFFYFLRGWLPDSLFNWLEKNTHDRTQPTRLVHLTFWVADACLLQFIRLINTFMPWLGGLFFLVFIVALWRQRYYLAMILGSCMFLIASNFVPLFLPRSQIIQANSPTLTVMTYNLWYNRHNRDFSETARLISQIKPDIVLLQEIGLDQTWQLQAELLKLTPQEPLYIVCEDHRLEDYAPGSELYLTYQHDQLFPHRPGAKIITLQTIISRYPITPISTDDTRGRAQKTIVHTPQGIVHVWNVHPPHPLSYWQWYYQYQRMWWLSQDVTMTKGPLIVGGDFNATEQSEIYGLLHRHLTSAYRESGWGLGFSFLLIGNQMVRWRGSFMDIPIMRIDHIFYRDDFVADNAYIVPQSAGSDHLPLVAKLVWRGR